MQSCGHPGIEFETNALGGVIYLFALFSQLHSTTVLWYDTGLPSYTTHIQSSVFTQFQSYYKCGLKQIF